jgi:hypothetical protein
VRAMDRPGDAHRGHPSGDSGPVVLAVARRLHHNPRMDLPPLPAEPAPAQWPFVERICGLAQGRPILISQARQI